MAAEERRGTRVTFLDQTGAKSVEAVIADAVTVKRILPNIITKMNLPVMGPDGQPMSYSLDHKEGGKRLREDPKSRPEQAQRRSGAETALLCRNCAALVPAYDLSLL
jgi:hypothetical protein